jgi:N-acetylneuraminic acid mutarotase
MFLMGFKRFPRHALLVVCAMAYTAFPPKLYGQSYPNLPEPVSNNGVAYVENQEQKYLLSFMGLGAGKTYQDVHNKVWALPLNDSYQAAGLWQVKQAVPSSLPLIGRLATVAVGIQDKAYVFGGYTVDKAHNEVSSADSFAFDVFSNTYSLLAPMPVPVDDAVALVYQERYIYLISGWHDDGNVNLVQLYDIQTDTWQQASPFLGHAVFGHAGGIVDGFMLVCDGVKVQGNVGIKRSFVAEAACYTGAIDNTNPRKIDWQVLPHPTGVARYRMAAVGDPQSQQIWFIGGANNPYNYNGVGYNSIPSEPSQVLWTFAVANKTWQVTSLLKASMDHRGALVLPHKDPKSGALSTQVIILGGMGAKQKSLARVSSQIMD